MAHPQTKTEEDEALEEADNEHRLAQRALRLKSIAIPEGKIRRYHPTVDESDRYTCDVVWVDRLTGKEVFRYDAADPANTNSYYGAESDESRFKKRDLDPYELIDKEQAKPMPVFYRYDDWEDDD